MLHPGDFIIDILISNCASYNLSLILLLSFPYFQRNFNLKVLIKLFLYKKDYVYSLSLHLPGQKDVNWIYIKRSEDVADIFGTFYVSSICVLFPKVP